MKGFYYALAGICNDFSYAARLGRYHAWHGLMRLSGWISIRAGKIERRGAAVYDYYYARASRLERKKK